MDATLRKDLKMTTATIKTTTAAALENAVRWEGTWVDPTQAEILGLPPVMAGFDRSLLAEAMRDALTEALQRALADRESGVLAKLGAHGRATGWEPSARVEPAYTIELCGVESVYPWGDPVEFDVFLDQLRENHAEVEIVGHAWKRLVLDGCVIHRREWNDYVAACGM